MPLYLDPKTRQQIDGAGSYFFNPTYPVSANFNGPMPGEKVQKIHINPNESIRLIQNKPQLMKHLSSKQLPVTPNFPVGQFKKNGMINLPAYQRALEPDKNTIVFRAPGMASEVDGIPELAAFMQDPEADRSIFQKLPVGYQSGVVSAIPALDGKTMRNVTLPPVTNGVFGNTIPAQFAQNNAKVEKAAKDAVEAANLDYGHVVFAFNPEDPDSFEILDLSTTLNPTHTPVLRAYMDMLYHASNTRKNVAKFKRK